MDKTKALLVCVGLVTLWFFIREETPSVVAQPKPAAPAGTDDQDKAKQDKARQDRIDEKLKKTPLQAFMRLKLAASNQVLEGLVVDDLDLVVQGSDSLLEISAAEKWRASNDMMYLQNSRGFRRSVEVLRDKAKKKSIDGAALAWVDVTMSCIHCHEWVRNVLIADLSTPNGTSGPVDLTKTVSTKAAATD